MATSEIVYNKIKEMSLRTINPYRRILLKEIAAELFIQQDALLVLLIELENRGLIKVHRRPIVSVSLTNYGISNSNPPGGLSSD